MSYCYCDYEMPTVYRAATHTARKEHKCRECARIIKPGERYEYVFAIWEGEACHVRTCSHCLSLREWVKAHVPCFCWGHGEMIEAAINTAPGFWFGTLRRQVAIEHARGYRRARHNGKGYWASVQL
jgi:hypothetical protein